MSQNNIETDNNGETGDKFKKVKKLSFIEILIPVLTLMTIVNCIVILVLVVNIGKKVNGLEQRLLAIQSSDVDEPYQEVSAMTSTDINGNTVDATEAVDIAEAAAYENNHVWNGRDESSAGIKRVYFTFDDGPSANTDRILDILDQYGVKATFFVVGKEKYPEQYKRIVADGHTLGMHSYSHKYNEIYDSLDAYKHDLTQLHDFLYELTGVDCSIVRFPGGSSNTISKVDMWELIDYLDEEGMVYFDWNVSSGDAAGGYINASQIARNVLDNVSKYNNSVILFHDAAGKDSTVDALPAIIEAILESDDTVILPISEDTVRVQHLHK
ncbi:MAG: polysaccharide deacetylase [Lachnospiraceae bacterium]|nr:polysaccharide deacetylase [Lachnospiraceae bacterium]